MASKRDQIQMTVAELRAFLAAEMIVTCATTGVAGRPHLMPLWYVVGDTSDEPGFELRGWTFAKSQKAKNLERDPRATLQVEAGIAYHELRGVMLECDVAIEREAEAVGGYGVELFRRYAPAGADDETPAELPEAVHQMVLAQAPKRVGLRFTPTRIVSWDHRKLGGVY